MPRKRMLDPGLWTDEDFASLSLRQQLLFVGLFSTADDEGRLKGSVAAVKLMLPAIYATVSLGKIATDIAAVCQQMPHVHRYEVDGRPYIYFDNYPRWQKIDHPTPSTNPPPSSIKEGDSSNAPRGLTEDSTSPHRGLRNSSRLARARNLVKGNLVESSLVKSSRGEKNAREAANVPRSLAEKAGRTQARAKTPPKQTLEKPLEDELIAEFAPVLGGEGRARAAITKALNHPASLGIDRNQGLRDWLREDAERYAVLQETRNGTTRRRSGQTPADDGLTAAERADIAKYDRIRELVDAEALGGRADAASPTDGAG